MKAIIINEFGGTDKLINAELPVPEPGEHEVLVKVHALSINPVDVKTREGKGVAGRLKTENPIILGWDISGEITAVGSAVNDFKVGDEVFGMVNFPGHGKAYAEYVAAPAAHLTLKPANVTHQQAAAATLAALTAYQALVKQIYLKKGQRILVHAAAGGVGHFVVQIAKHLGAYVIGTSSAANKEFVLGIGADEHIDYKSQRFEEVVKDVDAVFDALGAETILRSIPVVKEGGYIVSIPTTVPEEVAAKAKEKDVLAFFFLVQSSGADMKIIADLLEKGILRPYVNHYDFSQMDIAHQQQETGGTRGKIVLTLP
ncbi:NADP-dependent oxidoreductase [Chitinophaga pinensis]|uniref:Alcohol dehydrogenase zinc-binding domain protein n=1 Tax=Chitinophaga pinensis (strain ATCC 43595 / DSM 2588 / LMG 13176 / NBRC 15968 / NCIMB 11800 / UQM 2034) TaxID=485918 RepID=A0A979G7R3_CHIPD|nr:NADP-dependent oxidoreductase [Chitinophaga pinensis]ACU62293.1 Alcohol dehydrogenase zinc-binding domain protein [Chitinophaga pinensis DSM 2588]